LKKMVPVQYTQFFFSEYNAGITISTQPKERLFACNLDSRMCYLKASFLSL
jgi:hypothetical protein